MEYVEPYALLVAKLLQVGAVGLVWYVVHDDMSRFDLYVRTIYARSLGKQTEQFERILTSRQGDEYPIAICQQVEIHASFVELLSYLVFENLSFSSHALL